MPVATPPKVTEPFGKNAGAGYINNPIPLTTSTPGAASFDQGFPADTMTPIVSGGVPPFGQDINGILYMLSSHTAFLQAGQNYVFDASIASAIGGYAVGTILMSADASGYWINLTANNSVNPDTVTDGSFGGWAPMYSHGTATLSAATPGINIAVAPEAAAKQILIVTGAMTGNVQFQLPQAVQEWLIVNATTGAYSLTFTMAGSSVATAITQGGYNQPTGIWGDGTNLYVAYQPPLALAIDQAATPNTIVQRTNNAYVLASYFNQNSGLENPTIGAIFVQNTAADGFLRKISPSNLIGQLGIATLASPALTGVPTAPTAAANTNNGQIATTAYADAISVALRAILAPINAPVLTGSAQSPTPPTSDNSTRIATTAFVRALAGITGTLAVNGAANFAFGLQLRWGAVSQAAGNVAHAFSTPFTNACFVVIPVVASSTGVEFFTVVAGSETVNGWTQYANNATTVNYIAVGY